MSEEQPGSPEDQRIKPRFKAYCLEVTIRRRGWFGWRKEQIKVTCLDINRYGMAVVSPVPIGKHSKLLVNFRGQYITQSHVRAQVVSEQEYQPGGYRLGVQFCYCMDRRVYSRTVDNALSRIEALYRGKRGRRTEPMESIGSAAR